MIGFLFGVLAGVLACAWFPGFPRWVRGAWEVVGLRLQQLIAGVRPTTPNAPNIPIRAAARYAKPKNASPDFGRALSNLAGFLWTYKWALVVVLLFFFGMALANSWHLFGPSREELRLRAELAQAEARMQERLNVRDVEIARISAQSAANQQRLSHLAAQGRSEIEAARPANETPLAPDLERAWRAGIERLRADASADADRAHPSGPGA